MVDRLRLLGHETATAAVTRTAMTRMVAAEAMAMAQLAVLLPGSSRTSSSPRPRTRLLGQLTATLDILAMEAMVRLLAWGLLLVWVRRLASLTVLPLVLPPALRPVWTTSAL